ncbi:phosphopantetheine-binding protein [Marinobacter sp. M-5]|uniref:phosphopantetheine-binding protein n=1 Tax=Marinobacter sp. M-5 TaxID=3081089 RepID=UPI00293CF9A3|nr:phosphopantetheine-binding protein [Marinobacter sp. M-5]MDV3502360.1 phosphopantetheine-binding protein [Marinobacter sp. M-5]
MPEPTELTAIATALRHHLPAARMNAFAPDARLNEDLALDSIMLLELLVHLELEHRLCVPEEALLATELATVADLQQLLQPMDMETA